MDENRWSAICKKINKEKYKIAEARYAEDKYLLCKGEVDITEFMLEDGTYDSQCKSIINSYYESVEYFKECYADEEAQNQILAEMIFESTPYYDTKYKIVSEDDVEQSLFDFMAEEVSERYEIELKKYSQSDIRFVLYTVIGRELFDGKKEYREIEKCRIFDCIEKKIISKEDERISDMMKENMKLCDNNFLNGGSKYQQ